MSDDRAIVAKLKAYLAELTPETRAALVRSIDKARLRGQSDPLADQLLEAARLLAWETGEPLPRVASAMRRFYAPLEPFLIAEVTARKQTGRIARGSLAQIWTFLTRDLLPRRLPELVQAIHDAALADDEAGAEALTAQAVGEAIPALARVVANSVGDPERRRRLVGLLGTERALEDLEDVLRVYHLREGIAELLRSAPATVVDFNGDGVRVLLALVETFAQGSRERLLYALAALQPRFADPLQTLALAVAATGTDDPVRLESSDYKVAVDLALAEIDRAVQRLAQALAARRDPAPALKRFRHMARSLTTALDLSVASDWQRRLSELRRQASDLVGAEIEPTPALIRRALNPVDPRTNRRSPLDAQDAEQAVFAARLFTAARHGSDALAINDLLARLRVPVEKAFEIANERLSVLARSPDRALSEEALRRMPLAVEIASALFGDDYAAILRRGFAAAAQELAKAG